MKKEADRNEHMKLLIGLLVVLLMFFSGISAEGPSGLVIEESISEQTPALEEAILRSEEIQQPATEDKEQSFLQALFSLKSEEEQQELFALVEQYKQMNVEEALRLGVEQATSRSLVEE